DQKGKPAVPPTGIGWADVPSRARIQKGPPGQPTKARRRPSGDRARFSNSTIFSGKIREERIGNGGRGARRRVATARSAARIAASRAAIAEPSSQKRRFRLAGTVTVAPEPLTSER